VSKGIEGAEGRQDDEIPQFRILYNMACGMFGDGAIKIRFNGGWIDHYCRQRKNFEEPKN